MSRRYFEPDIGVIHFVIEAGTEIELKLHKSPMFEVNF
jgi:hypothetical protein